MKKLFTPDLSFDTIYEIKPELLCARGIEFVLCDLDNTIADYDTPVPDDAMRAWIKSLTDCGIAFAIVSNNEKERVEKFCAQLDIPYFWKSKKPRACAIDNALKELCGTREKCALIGDKRTTDVLCARRAGVLSVKVKSIKPRSILWRR